METKDNRVRIAVCVAFVVFFALVIVFCCSNTVQKYEVSDLTPLASTTYQNQELPDRVLKLDIDTGKDYGVIGICFRNVETKDKYFVDFNFNEGYIKDLALALPNGDYKIKLVNPGKLGKSKALPKTVSVTSDSSEIAITFN